MSMPEATLVDVGEVAPRRDCRSISHLPERMMPVMQSIAAYYVIVANDLARQSQTPRYQVVASRPGVRARLATALSALVRPGRATASSAA